MVSNTRGDTTKGDFKSYNYPDRNLVINWTDNSRGDGAAIRDAEVNAKILLSMLISQGMNGQIKALSVMQPPILRPAVISISLPIMTVYIRKGKGQQRLRDSRT